ncbi:DUF599 domain-containing protein [Tabrizicola fusiformis]|uniref:DUF599 domain-containing protein n=1 Tax=Tabrizicola sp. SY72 TaxID=2741673 RepID=UPI0015722775|nr:DUF599 domain-containing protein [Tabrizicola sp. SY72]NTT85618.1 DUF599 domain-containing protein [Tabrizicola sp. SY72]
MPDLIHLGPLSPLDLIALATLLAAWLIVGRLIEHPPASRPSVSLIMQSYRHDWMRQFVTRQPRIFDATMIDNLRQSTAFFASASMIAIGGGVALIGNPAPVLGLARDLTLPTEPSGLQMRGLLVVGLLANALLKFIWAHRLFGYCAILMASVPNDPADPQAYHRAEQAGEVNIHAAKSFNRGLRSIYFALGGLGWLLGPWGLIGATLATTAILIRREFASQSRAIMLRKA